MPSSLPYSRFSAPHWAHLLHIALSAPCSWAHCPMPSFCPTLDSLSRTGLSAPHWSLCPTLGSLPHTGLSAPHQAVSGMSLRHSSSRAQPCAGSADPALCSGEREMGGLEIPSEQKRGVLGGPWRIPPHHQTAPALAGHCRLALCLASLPAPEVPT